MSETDSLEKEPEEQIKKVPYGPVPMIWNISQVKGSDGNPLIAVNIQTAEGDKIFYVNPSVALQIGEAIIKLSTEALTLSEQPQ